MLKSILLLFGLNIIIWIVPFNLVAQVSPEIQLAGRGVMSINNDRISDKTYSSVNDFSDTGILLGFRQKMYNQFRGQLVIGFQFPDADSDLGQVFFHQTFLKIEDKTNILKMGRSRVRSTLIEFSTLRDDDALHFTDVLNPFSSGENTEDNQYGNVLELTRIFNQRYWIRIHGEHFTKTPMSPEKSETNFSLNALGISFEYRVPETQIWNRPILQQIGIGFNNFLTDRTGYSNKFDETLKNVLFSTILNLKRDPVYFWDFRTQTIYNLGFKEITNIQSFYDLSRARSISVFSSIRFLYRKLERPTLQFSFSSGYKEFTQLDQSTSQINLVFNGFYRVGSNFDTGLQIQYNRFDGDLVKLFNENEIRVQLALVYSVDQLWNSQFDDRESLLNLEHGYIP